MTKLKFLCIASIFCLAATIASPAQNLFTTLVEFDQTNGSYPIYTTLVQGPNGNFYGTTEGGGEDDFGTIFEMTPSGKVTILHSFSYYDGAYPYAGLVLASNKKLYGTTPIGGQNYDGTVFEITPTGTFTTLYNFCTQIDCLDGFMPYAALMQAADGNLYGTTTGGGFYQQGTIFQITTAGTLTTLHSFGETADGYLPYGQLVQASNKALYGTTELGGANHEGVVFKITTQGVFTLLHSFDFTDGSLPYGGLVQASNNELYGTTSNGGANFDFGTIFKITPAGQFSTVLNFDGLDGGSPYSQMMRASDGNLYGTSFFGPNGVGEIFQLTNAGKITVEHSFDYTDGMYPYGGLLQAADGTFYGVTEAGGGGFGTAYSLKVGAKENLSEAQSEEHDKPGDAPEASVR